MKNDFIVRYMAIMCSRIENLRSKEKKSQSKQITYTYEYRLMGADCVLHQSNNFQYGKLN